MSSEANYLGLHYIVPKTYKPTQQSKTLLYITVPICAIAAALVVIDIANNDMNSAFLAAVMIVICGAYFYSYNYATTEGITLNRAGVTILKGKQSIEIQAENIKGYNLTCDYGSKIQGYHLSLIYTQPYQAKTETIEFGWSPSAINDPKFIGWLNSMKNYGNSDISRLTGSMPNTKF